MTERRKDQIARDETVAAFAQESTARQEKVIELSKSHVEQLEKLSFDFEILKQSVAVNNEMTAECADSILAVKEKIEGIDVARLIEATEVLTKISGTAAVMRWVGGGLQWLGKLIAAVFAVYAAIRFGWPKQ